MYFDKYWGKISSLKIGPPKVHLNVLFETLTNYFIRSQFPPLQYWAIDWLIVSLPHLSLSPLSPFNYSRRGGDGSNVMFCQHNLQKKNSNLKSRFFIHTMKWIKNYIGSQRSLTANFLRPQHLFFVVAIITSTTLSIFGCFLETIMEVLFRQLRLIFAECLVSLAAEDDGTGIDQPF